MELIKIGQSKKEKEYTKNFRKGYSHIVDQETHQEKLVRERKEANKQKRINLLRKLNNRIIGKKKKKMSGKTNKYKYTTRKRIYLE